MKNIGAFFLSTIILWTTLAGVALAHVFNAHINHPIDHIDVLKIAAFAGLVTGGMATLMLYFIEEKKKRDDWF